MPAMKPRPCGSCARAFLPFRCIICLVRRERSRCPRCTGEVAMFSAGAICPFCVEDARVLRDPVELRLLSADYGLGLSDAGADALAASRSARLYGLGFATARVHVAKDKHDDGFAYNIALAGCGFTLLPGRGWIRVFRNAHRPADVVQAHWLRRIKAVAG